MTEDFSRAAESLLEGLTRIAAQAAAAILTIAPTALNVRAKLDHSPITAADETSEGVILEGLSQLLPDLPVVSEETTGHATPEALATRFALVDPLDGTRELLAGRDEYTVNIALMERGRPLIGVVAAPALGLLWRGIVGMRAERMILSLHTGTPVTGEPQPIQTRPRPLRGPVALVSRSHLDVATEAYLDRLQIAEKIPCGSSLKFCRLAEGSADVYPRLAPTFEWDVGAGHALLLAAGGTVIRPDGGDLRYGQSDFRIPGFLAWGDRAAAGKI